MTVKREIASTFPPSFLKDCGSGTKLVIYEEGDTVFSQGDRADSIYYVQDGKIKLSVVSRRGREAVIALLGDHSFFGEGCLAGQPLRMANATALMQSSLVRVDKALAFRLLAEDAPFVELLLSYMLTRTMRVEEDLVDQLFNSSEKRLARALLTLANFGKEGKPQKVVAKVSQEMLAEMIGTTRSRVSFFMNKFRRLGFISYNGTLEVHDSLLSVVLND